MPKKTTPHDTAIHHNSSQFITISTHCHPPNVSRFSPRAFSKPNPFPKSDTTQKPHEKSSHRRIGKFRARISKPNPIPRACKGLGEARNSNLKVFLRQSFAPNTPLERRPVLQYNKPNSDRRPNQKGGQHGRDKGESYALTK